MPTLFLDIFRQSVTIKGKKNKAIQNNTISFGIISESEFAQGVNITVIRNADQHNKLK